VPKKELPSPNIRPKPINRKPSEETAKTIKFLERMLTAFFALAKPKLSPAVCYVSVDNV
jgi:hypothetical protein